MDAVWAQLNGSTAAAGRTCTPAASAFSGAIGNPTEDPGVSPAAAGPSHGARGFSLAALCRPVAQRSAPDDKDRVRGLQRLFQQFPCLLKPVRCLCLVAPALVASILGNHCALLVMLHAANNPAASSESVAVRYGLVELTGARCHVMQYLLACRHPT